MTPASEIARRVPCGDRYFCLVSNRQLSRDVAELQRLRVFVRLPRMRSW